MKKKVLTPEVIDELVRKTIENNRDVTRDCASQTAVDRCIEAVYADGEVELAAVLMLASATRVAGLTHGALQCLMQFMVTEALEGRLPLPP